MKETEVSFTLSSYNEPRPKGRGKGWRQFARKHPEVLRTFEVAIVVCPPNPHDQKACREFEATSVSARMKQKHLTLAGFPTRVLSIASNADENYFVEQIIALREASHIKGIIVQLPLPEKFRKHLPEIGREKDIDGLVIGTSKSSTAAEAAVRVLGEVPAKATVAVVGNKGFIGGSVTRALQQEDVSVAPFDIGDDLRGVKDFPFVIAAANKAHILDANALDGQRRVIDAGYSKTNAGSGVGGNVDPAAYSRVTSITPVPGGIAPYSIAVLVERMLNKARISVGEKEKHWVMAE